jgi:hypothetical protein
MIKRILFSLGVLSYFTLTWRINFSASYKPMSPRCYQTMPCMVTEKSHQSTHRRCSGRESNPRDAAVVVLSTLPPSTIYKALAEHNIICHRTHVAPKQPRAVLEMFFSTCPLQVTFFHGCLAAHKRLCFPSIFDDLVFPLSCDSPSTSSSSSSLS